MKFPGYLTFIAMLFVCSRLVFAQQEASPAEMKIAAAARAIEANPNRYDSYNDLALAQARRARETADPSYYDAAEEALENSLRLAPNNLEAERIEVWVLLGKHEFGKALERATALNKRIPDDVMVYGFLADANIELGNYKEAEIAAQWMLDLRPGNVPALTRAAYLRELFGDIEGAIDLMQSAYQRIPYLESEDRAWTLTQLAHLNMMIGKIENADRMLQSALALFPGYHYALANLAKVRTAQNRHEDAARLLKDLYRIAPHPENLYIYAKAVERSGQPMEAKALYSRFEQDALRESEGTDNSNRELIYYYVDVAGKPDDALKIARLEIARRQDTHTLEAYAWALQSKGNYGDARKQMERALEVGIRDAGSFYHAGLIAKKAGDRVAAERFFQESLRINPQSEVADALRNELGKGN
jgi:tetratricopeptide (TPR) repeat protein